MTEEQLLVSLKNGDKVAFDAIFEKYASHLYYFSVNMLKDENDAREIVQETFLKIWETRASVDPSLNFKSYIIQIARNKIYNVIRRKVVEKRYESAKLEADNVEPTVEKSVEQEDLRRYLSLGIDRLSPHQKEVVVLKSRGLSNDEISKLLGLSKRTVEGHINKAYRQLRQELEWCRDSLMILWVSAFF